MATGAYLAIAAIGTGVSIKQRRQAQKAQEGATEAERKSAEVQNARRRRQALAQSRVETARIRNLGSVTGTSDSSSVKGAAGSVQSDVAGAIGFQRGLVELNNRRLGHLTDASRHSTRANTASQVASFSAQFAGLPGDKDKE